MLSAPGDIKQQLFLTHSASNSHRERRDCTKEDHFSSEMFFLLLVAPGWAFPSVMIKSKCRLNFHHHGGGDHRATETIRNCGENLIKPSAARTKVFHHAWVRGEIGYFFFVLFFLCVYAVHCFIFSIGTGWSSFCVCFFSFHGRRMIVEMKINDWKAVFSLFYV